MTKFGLFGIDDIMCSGMRNSENSLQAPHHVVSVCSHRFFQPNWSPESKTGYQKQSIGTVSGSLVLNLSLDNLFWVSIL